MERLKKAVISIISGGIPILGLLTFVAVLYFGVKSTFIKIWIPPDETVIYRIERVDNSSLNVVLMPENNSYIVYSEEDPKYEDIMVAKTRGAYATHYFWRLWNIARPDRNDFRKLLGFRIYHPNAKPVIMEIEVLDRLINGKRSGAKTGKFEKVIGFRDDAILFDGMWLKKNGDGEGLVSEVELKIGVGK